MNSLTESKLQCSYTGPKEISAFMILQPLKREQISLNPPVTVFYDFVSDQEIEILKALAKPKVYSLFSTIILFFIYLKPFFFFSYSLCLEVIQIRLLGKLN